MKKIVLLILSLFALVGCSLSNTPSSKVEFYLDEYNKVTDNVLQDLETQVASENLSQENKDLYKNILLNQYKNMKYEIKDETIDGDNAVVKVKLTVIDLFKSSKNSSEYMNNNINEFYDTNGIFSDDLFNTYKLNNMNKMKDTIEYDVSFSLIKKDKEWVLQSPDRTTLEKIHGLYDYTND